MFYLTEEVHCKVRYSCEVESGDQSLSLSDSKGRRRGNLRAFLLQRIDYSGFKLSTYLET
jgi:hypothetical protein